MPDYAVRGRRMTRRETETETETERAREGESDASKPRFARADLPMTSRNDAKK